jgi:hypothetical protein
MLQNSMSLNPRFAFELDSRSGLDRKSSEFRLDISKIPPCLAVLLLIVVLMIRLLPVFLPLALRIGSNPSTRLNSSVNQKVRNEFRDERHRNWASANSQAQASKHQQIILQVYVTWKNDSAIHGSEFANAPSSQNNGAEQPSCAGKCSCSRMQTESAPELDPEPGTELTEPDTTGIATSEPPTRNI